MQTEIKIYNILKTFMYEVTLEDKFIDILNKYLDNLLKQEDRTSHAGKLVGQIKHGEQLKMDHTCEDLKEFDTLTNKIAQQYLQQYIQISATTRFNESQVGLQTDEMWSVHSYAGDYNPLHDNGTKTLAGMSWTPWTKIPKQISERDDSVSMYNSSGVMDGNLVFCWQPGGIRMPDILEFPQMLSVKPEVGKLYMFPSWSPHMVYPFEGEGERRTVAGNINIWVKQDEK